jgi:hypothetical protein
MLALQKCLHFLIQCTIAICQVLESHFRPVKGKMFASVKDKQILYRKIYISKNYETNFACSAQSSDF